MDNDSRLKDNERAVYTQPPENSMRITNFVGQSPAFKSILDTIRAVAIRKCSVIITGETGAGKEMVARQLHLESARKDKVFVPVDCTTLTGQLFESQLFGHIKGAFTGAVNESVGFFRAADSGTIFLDEISEIPIELQAKLLRVLQQGRVSPLGSTKSYPIDVRVVCASNKNLQEMVEQGKFRADLYYRLNVINLKVPSLRQRRSDIVRLAEHFLARQAEFYDEPYKQLSEDTKRMLVNYDWPGNVRQLSNAMERAYVLTRGQIIEPSSLPFEVFDSDSPEYPKNELPTLAQVKRRVITQTLQHTNGRKMAAARILDIDRRKLNRLIDRLNIAIHKENNKS